jgi:hypothetical protein
MSRAVGAAALFVVLVVGGLEAVGFGESGALGLVYVATAFAVVGSCVVGLVRRRRTLTVRGLGIAAVAIAGLVTAWLVESEQVRESERRGDDICAALEDHRARVGTYPAHLSDLVPADLPRIPVAATGVVRSFDFAYEPVGDDDFELRFATPHWKARGRGARSPWTWYD